MTIGSQSPAQQSSGPADFASDCRVGDGQAVISKSWSFVAPVGGYVCTVALRAAAQVTSKARPISMNCDFVRGTVDGPIQFTTQVLATGTLAELIEVKIFQNAKLTLDARIWCANPMEGIRHQLDDCPSVTPAHLCKDVAVVMAETGADWMPPLYNQVDLRVVDVPVAGVVAPKPEQSTWFRYRVAPGLEEDPFLRFGRMLIPVDIQPWFAACLVHAPAETRDMWPKTTSLSLQFHRLPPNLGWNLIQARSDFAEDGCCSGRASVWSESGELLLTGVLGYVCPPRRK